MAFVVVIVDVLLVLLELLVCVGALEVETASIIEIDGLDKLVDATADVVEDIVVEVLLAMLEVRVVRDTM